MSIAAQPSVAGRNVVVHPAHIERGVYIAMQEEHAWTLPVELIDGQPVLMPPPVGNDSAAAQDELHGPLWQWCKQAGARGTLRQDMFIDLPGTPPGSFLAPDIAWWANGRYPAAPKGPPAVVPDLVVEVLSPDTRENDLGPKRELYLRDGVRELWLVDPPARTITVVTGGTERLLREADSLQSPLLPGFELPVADVFSGIPRQ